MKAIDYDEVSKRYDSHRSLDAAVAEDLFETGCPPPGSKILELGCGTGGMTVHLEALHEGPIVGLDASRGMLDRARSKLSRTTLVRGDATRLPFAAESFSMACGVFFVHYIGAEMLPTMAAEIARVLARGASVVIVTTAHHQIRGHMLCDFFPSFAEIDCARFPKIADLRAALAGAGLTADDPRPVEVADYALDERYVEKLRARHVSTLELLPEGEFESGLAEFTGKTRAGELPARYTHYATIVAATKP